LKGFISNSVFVYPAAILAFGYKIPLFLQYQDKCEENKNFGGSGIELKFLAMIYSLGLAFIKIPSLFTTEKDFESLS